MNQTIITVFLLSTLAVIGVTQMAAIMFPLYVYYPWLDIPMHFFAGASVAFFVLLLPQSSLKIPKRYSTLVPTLAVTLCVGLLWELYEILIGIPLAEPGFGSDMLKDIVADLFGGILGYGVGTRVSMLK